MKQLFIIGTFFLTFSSTIAQSNPGYAGRKFVSDLFLVDEYIKRTDQGVQYDDVDSYKGTPYNNPVFLPGNIYKEDELLAADVALRYNAVADEMEVKESLLIKDSEARVLTKSPDIYVKINGDIFVFVTYKGGVEKGGYFLVQFEGVRVDLFKKLHKKFTPAKKASSSITNDVPAKFTDKPIYYLVNKEGKFFEFPKSKSKKLKVFGNKQKEIKEFVKKNKLDLNKEKDLLKTVQYYDTL